ncbi:MAG: excinuclease ABC subunit UvrA [Nitrospinota bacterium]|nr:excinuclease ABC subunit UvrA [Nitrospinota bacterium]
MADKIVIRGANEHNLKNITITLPRDKLVVITGVSGSGKSSLAFDTIYAEGQRRYVESLSAYARQFLEQMEKPEVESIEGLSPAISIEQKTTSRNPRSTVGTVTEIYDYLRLLFARIGDVHCYKCNLPISSLTATQIVDRMMEFTEGTRIQVLSPIIRDRKGEYRKELDQFRAKGFVRVRVDGQMRDLGEDIVLDKKKKHTIELVVDRLVMKEGLRRRLADSVELALKMSDGLVQVNIGGEEEILYSERHACPNCDISYPELAPRMFSFNNPHGACPACLGLGEMKRISPDLVIPFPQLSVLQGAVKPWSRSTARYYQQTLSALAVHYGFKLDIPFEKLPTRIQQIVLFGSGEEEIQFNLDSGKRRHIFEGPFEGVIPNLERRYKETDSVMVREELEEYMRLELCSRCDGRRLRVEALAVTVGGKSIMDASSLSVKGGLEFFENIKLTTRQKHIGRRVIKEVTERLGFLRDVGLDYLTLDRAAATLSGGEGQRIRLATQIGSSLMGVLYILDEPSIGLHQRDNKRLIETLIKLRDLGNTVIVVEHDEDMILTADYVVDMGPGAGIHGGEVVSEGTPENIMKDKKSLTGQYLSGKLSIPTPLQRRRGNGRSITLQGATAHNLKDVDMAIPLGAFTCITGVSGSGKSTLLLDILYKALAVHFWGSHDRPGAYRKLEGLEHIDKVIDIDQNPIGRTPRSNPATYTGVFTEIRDLFSNLPESRKRGYKPGRFSFNVKGGRCETCQGDGIIKIEMHFLPDVYVACEECGGHRFNRETLEIELKGKSIAEILEMTVEEALTFFENHRSIEKTLATLNDVGMEYIKLGQSATTLSGGEAQRVKLSKELSKRSTGRTLYILDEPTTGLHFDDVRKLLKVLNRLTNAGNTLVVIEHNMDVIKTADYLVDLGPEGGDAGGYIIAAGTPEEVAKVKRSQTGQALKKVLARGK